MPYRFKRSFHFKMKQRDISSLIRARKILFGDNEERTVLVSDPQRLKSLRWRQTDGQTNQKHKGIFCKKKCPNNSKHTK